LLGLEILIRLGKQNFRKAIVAEALLDYLSPEYRYEFNNGPNVVRDPETARAIGLNCEVFVFLALEKLFGHRLPERLRALEMYRDRTLFIDIDTIEQSQKGDVVFFTPSGGRAALDSFIPLYDSHGSMVNAAQMPRVHLAVSMGAEAATCEIELMHANYNDQGVSIWPLARFSEHPRYREIAGIKRLEAA
jgi:hypothetical protein